MVGATVGQNFQRSSRSERIPGQNALEHGGWVGQSQDGRGVAQDGRGVAQEEWDYAYKETNAAGTVVEHRPQHQGMRPFIAELGS